METVCKVIVLEAKKFVVEVRSDDDFINVSELYKGTHQSLSKYFHGKKAVEFPLECEMMVYEDACDFVDKPYPPRLAVSLVARRTGRPTGYDEAGHDLVEWRPGMTPGVVQRMGNDYKEIWVHPLIARHAMAWAMRKVPGVVRMEFDCLELRDGLRYGGEDEPRPPPAAELVVEIRASDKYLELSKLFTSAGRGYTHLFYTRRRDADALLSVEEIKRMSVEMQREPGIDYDNGRVTRQEYLHPPPLVQGYGESGMHFHPFRIHPDLAIRFAAKVSPEAARAVHAKYLELGVDLDPCIPPLAVVEMTTRSIGGCSVPWPRITPLNRQAEAQSSTGKKRSFDAMAAPPSSKRHE